MNPNWQDFLRNQGAVFLEDGRIQTFGHSEVERFLVKNGPILSNQSHQALLQVSGEDAFDFLQGQLTNDLTEVTAEQAQLSAYCDPQGQVLALFTVFLWQGDYFLSFDGSLKESIQKRLQMFIMRSKVTLADRSEDLVQLGFAGDFADVDVQRQLLVKVKEVYQVVEINHDEIQNSIAIKQPGPYHKFLIIGPAEGMQTAWTHLRTNCDAVNNLDWQLMQVVNGMPEITAATSGQWIAQFLNLDKLGAINFKKGCFPGQEVIARMHYRGKATKRMLRLHFANTVELAAGNEFKLQDEVGKSYKFNTILASHDSLNGSVALAITTLKSLQSAQGRLINEQGVTVEIEPLPYDLSED